MPTPAECKPWLYILTDVRNDNKINAEKHVKFKTTVCKAGPPGISEQEFPGIPGNPTVFKFLREFPGMFGFHFLFSEGTCII